MLDQIVHELPEPPRARAVAAEDIGSYVDHALELAVHVGRTAPLPGAGNTPKLWGLLAELGRADLALARITEPHLDALAILAQAGTEPEDPDASWAVWAAEGAGTRLEAHPEPSRGPDAWRLCGRKPWCSLAGHVDRAIVTAHVYDAAGRPTGTRRAFAVDAQNPGLEPGRAGRWRPLGLEEVITVTADFRDVPATPVGSDGWYLTRPGFAWGGAGVAAVWLGGARGVADLLWRACAAPTRPLDDAALTHLGAVDLALHGAAAVLEHTAHAVDSGAADGDRGAILALRARRTVARCAEDVLREVSHATGPGPLSGDAEHIRRVTALSLYIRQDHAQRDTRELGRAVLGDAPDPQDAPW